MRVYRRKSTLGAFRDKVRDNVQSSVSSKPRSRQCLHVQNLPDGVDFRIRDADWVSPESVELSRKIIKVQHRTIIRATVDIHPGLFDIGSFPAFLIYRVQQ